MRIHEAPFPCNHEAPPNRVWLSIQTLAFFMSFEVNVLYCGKSLMSFDPFQKEAFYCAMRCPFMSFLHLWNAMPAMRRDSRPIYQKQLGPKICQAALLPFGDACWFACKVQAEYTCKSNQVHACELTIHQNQKQSQGNNRNKQEQWYPVLSFAKISDPAFPGGSFEVEPYTLFIFMFRSWCRRFGHPCHDVCIKFTFQATHDTNSVTLWHFTGSAKMLRRISFVVPEAPIANLGNIPRFIMTLAERCLHAIETYNDICNSLSLSLSLSLPKSGWQSALSQGRVAFS